MFGQFPAVLVTGPRQSGKTALLRTLFPKAAYVSLDTPAIADSAQNSAEEFLGDLQEPVILDEIQYAPGLFRALKTMIDRRRRPGRFLLTGSQNFLLMQGVSESLAGRCGILNLHTLSWDEYSDAFGRRDVRQFIFAGGFPELHAGAKIERDFWYPAYVATYLERDVRNVLRVQDLGDFNRFLRAAALRTAQILSYSDLARDVGITPNTAKKWMSVLVASGHIFLLEAYHRNLGKRLVKSPKLVFIDTGLLVYLMGFNSMKDALSSPLAGAIWETHVTGQLVRHYAFSGQRPPLWYWRTPYGHEVDIVIEEGGGRMTPVECKLSEHPTNRDCAGIRAIESFYGESEIVKSLVACRTPVSYRIEGKIRAVNGSSWPPPRS